MAGKWKASSALVKSSLSMVTVAFILQVLSFIAPYWTSTKSAADGRVILTSGLWMKCGDKACTGLTSTPVWFQVAVAFEVISVVSGILAYVLILVIICSCTKDTEPSKCRNITAPVFSIFAAISMQIAVAMFIQNQESSGPDTPLSWCVAVNILSIASYVVCGLLLLADVFRVCLNPVVLDNKNTRNDVKPE